MPMKRTGPGEIRKIARDLFTQHEDHYPSPIGWKVLVNKEPNGQEVLDTGKLVPIFEAIVIEGPERDMVLQVAQEELE